MERSSSSSSMATAVAFLAIIFICCSLPGSAAIHVQTEGNQQGERPPPCCGPNRDPSTYQRCCVDRKTLQQPLAN